MIEHHQLRFPLRDELEHVEDQYFSLRAHVFAGAVSYVDQPLYHYRIHLTSIVQSYQKKLFDSGLVLYRLNEAFCVKTAAYRNTGKSWIFHRSARNSLPAE